MNWKTEFVELYMSNNIDNFRQALELKRKNIPEKLYRFRSVRSEENLARVLNEIISGQLYMAHPDELNDPFGLNTKQSMVSLKQNIFH